MPDQERSASGSGELRAGAIEDGYAVRLYPLDESEEIRLLDLWRAVWSGKWLIVVCSVALALLAVAVSFLITPQYRSQVVLSPVGSSAGGGLAALAGQFGGLASLAGINIGAEDNVAESIAILKSRALTERFIRRNRDAGTAIRRASTFSISDSFIRSLSNSWLNTRTMSYFAYSIVRFGLARGAAQR